MLQIRLSKPANETGVSAKPAPTDSVTVACPDHLVLADLPVAKSLGSASANAVIKTIGRRSRRHLGERVHFCVRCDFPIAIYGRLSPCEHAFCLDCARSDSLCYLCDGRVQKIQTIKMMEGIFICAAPHCLKSFLKKSDFEWHINETHADLLHPGKEREGNETEAISARKSSASDSTVQAPLRQVFSPGSNSQVHEDKTQQRPQTRDLQPPLRPVMQQTRPMPPFSGQAPNYPSEQQQQHADTNQPHNRFPQQTFDPQGQGGLRQESVNNPNSAMVPPQFGYPPYGGDGAQQFFGAQYEMGRTDSTPEAGSGQGSMSGFMPGPTGPVNFGQNYPQQWNMAPTSLPMNVDPSQGTNTDGFMNVDPQGRGFYRGDYGQNVGPTPPTGNYMDTRDGKGILAPQPMSNPPPPQSAQIQRDRSYSGDGNHDAPPGFGWQQD
ncbi:hypothetical protein ABFS83_10G022800 [Erythranthe nasuta]